MVKYSSWMVLRDGKETEKQVLSVELLVAESKIADLLDANIGRRTGISCRVDENGKPLLIWFADDPEGDIDCHLFEGPDSELRLLKLSALRLKVKTKKRDNASRN